MGKRKFKEEIEEEEICKKRKIKLEVAEEEEEEEICKKRKIKLEVAEEEEQEEVAAQHSAWLIRKPINLPIDELRNIHFSRKASLQCQTMTMPSHQRTSSSAEPTGYTMVECHLKKSTRPMLHVISDRKRNFDEKVPMTQGSCLRGIVWVNNIELQRTTAGNDGDGAEAAFSNGLLPNLDDDDDGDVVPSLHIESIRRKPVVDEQMLRERLKAFGTTAHNF